MASTLVGAFLRSDAGRQCVRLLRPGRPASPFAESSSPKLSPPAPSTSPPAIAAAWLARADLEAGGGGGGDPESPLAVRIGAFENRRPGDASNGGAGGGKFYVYAVDVTPRQAGRPPYRVWRRYSEFFAMHARLQQLLAAMGVGAAVALPKLPPKHLFQRSQVEPRFCRLAGGGASLSEWAWAWVRTQLRAVAERRMHELDAYLQQLLALPTAAAARPCRLFFAPADDDHGDGTDTDD